MPQDTTSAPENDIGIYPGIQDATPAQEYIYDSTLIHLPPARTDNAADYEKYSGNDMLALKIVLFILLGSWLLVKFFSKNPLHLDLDESYGAPGEPITVHSNTCLVFKGNELIFPEEVLRGILEKRFPYFNILSPGEQRRFLLRHKRFMRDKVFKIHDAKGFKEMPVLISAAAIQLSFGLEEYMLPYYTYINIFPQEFLRAGADICFLQGNVSGNNIKISWKHFLEGYELPDNGENVGLHEMAHAYYCQNFLCGDEPDKYFTKGFPAFTACGEKAFEAEHANTTDLYSDYALRNFQEFWAESIEIFFEQPADMKRIYPEVYDCLSVLLNQSP